MVLYSHTCSFESNQAIMYMSYNIYYTLLSIHIGGILYSLEEMSSYFPSVTMFRALFCSLIAALTVQFVDPFQEGKLVQFQISYSNAYNWFELIPFALVGCIGGLTGAFFIKFNLSCQHIRRNSKLLKYHPIVEIGIVIIITSTVKYMSSYTRGTFNGILEVLFGDCNHLETSDPLQMCNLEYVGNTCFNLLFLYLTSLLLSTYTIGTKVPSGLLVPSLVIGGSMGRLIGTLVRWLQLSYPNYSLFSNNCSSSLYCITPGIYSLVGGASVMAGITRMSITIAVIMSEITGGLTYLLPVMIGLLFSKLTGDAFGRESIYEGAIQALKYPFLDVKDEIPTHLKVKDSMTLDNLFVLSMDNLTVAELYHAADIMQQLSLSGSPVVTDYHSLYTVGYISRIDLLNGLNYNLKENNYKNIYNFQSLCYFAINTSSSNVIRRYGSNCIDLRSWLSISPIQVSDQMPLHRLHDLFSKLGLRYCLVTRFGKLIGIVTKKDVLRAVFRNKHSQIS